MQPLDTGGFEILCGASSMQLMMCGCALATAGRTLNYAEAVCQKHYSSYCKLPPTMTKKAGWTKDGLQHNGATG